MTGELPGNYEILDKLGEGGMGEVWRVRDQRLNRMVAVKILPREVADDPSSRSRFEQEARALGALNHPNIVTIYDVGQDEGRAYIVSELVEGEALRAVLDRGPVPVRKAIEIAGPIYPVEGGPANPVRGITGSQDPVGSIGNEAAGPFPGQRVVLIQSDLYVAKGLY